jgi:hypothetical protein
MTNPVHSGLGVSLLCAVTTGIVRAVVMKPVWVETIAGVMVVVSGICRLLNEPRRSVTHLGSFEIRTAPGTQKVQ